MGMSLKVWIELTGSVLLFCLVFGMSATVDFQNLRHQLKNVQAITTGLFVQFVILPFLGFLSVRIMGLDHPTGVVLLVVTSSPGGSYSNWWCSMFNAELALSVTMTAISTLLSCIMLPVNLLIYSHHSYNAEIVESLDWGSLVSALAIVIVGIACGLIFSAKFPSNELHLLANRVGNVAGVLLVTFSCVMSNLDKNARVWNREATFYFGVALPCLFGLIIANVVTSAIKLWEPERVAVCVECCYQNVGIATSVAISMFHGDALAEAVAVPFYYGIIECILLLCYCVGAWKAGWTKAPPEVSFWQMLFTSYEVLSTDELEPPSDKAETVDPDAYHIIDHNDATVIEEDQAKA